MEASRGPLMSRCNWLFSSTREALGAGASVREIVLRPEPLLHQLEHVTALHLGMVLRDGLLHLSEVTLAADPRQALSCGAVGTRRGATPSAADANERAVLGTVFMTFPRRVTDLTRTVTARRNGQKTKAAAHHPNTVDVIGCFRQHAKR